MRDYFARSSYFAINQGDRYSSMNSSSVNEYINEDTIHQLRFLLHVIFAKKEFKDGTIVSRSVADYMKVKVGASLYETVRCI